VRQTTTVTRMAKVSASTPYRVYLGDIGGFEAIFGVFEVVFGVFGVFLGFLRCFWVSKG
jgi:hypothetical protein